MGDLWISIGSAIFSGASAIAASVAAVASKRAAVASQRLAAIEADRRQDEYGDRRMALHAQGRALMTATLRLQAKGGEMLYPGGPEITLTNHGPAEANFVTLTPLRHEDGSPIAASPSRWPKLSLGESARLELPVPTVISRPIMIRLEWRDLLGFHVEERRLDAMN